jgi:hypothetical protein
MVDPMGPHLSNPCCSWQTPNNHQLQHEQLWDQAQGNASHIQIEFKWFLGMGDMYLFATSTGKGHSCLVQECYVVGIQMSCSFMFPDCIIMWILNSFEVLIMMYTLFSMYLPAQCKVRASPLVLPSTTCQVGFGRACVSFWLTRMASPHRCSSSMPPPPTRRQNQMNFWNYLFSLYQKLHWIMWIDGPNN